MCIIAIKPIGIKMPNIKTIENCWYNNPDGAGFMYAKESNVYIEKGLYEVEKSQDSFKRT